MKHTKVLRASDASAAARTQCGVARSSPPLATCVAVGLRLYLRPAQGLYLRPNQRGVTLWP